MKILFAIQGTGNGHLSRARDIYPELAKHGEVDVLISGIQADVEVPFPVKYRYYGLSFIFGKTGGVDIWATVRRMKPLRLMRDINKLPVQDYEPVSAWACKLKGRPCISLSHQSAVLNRNAPQPAATDMLGYIVLKRYAPVTAAYGFHFRQYDENIFTPVIRRDVRNMQPTDEGHYTVYLPAYSDKTIVENLSQIHNAEWRVFSKHNKKPFAYKNVQVRPIENKAFIHSMASGTGVLCGAGFEGPAEALYLGKKLMVIPMHTQYEQQCNAAALADLGVPVIEELSARHHEKIKWWAMTDHRVQFHVPDNTTQIVADIVAKHALAETQYRRVSCRLRKNKFVNCSMATLILFVISGLFMTCFTALAYHNHMAKRIPVKLVYVLSILLIGFLAIPFLSTAFNDMRRIVKLAIAVSYSGFAVAISITTAGRLYSYSSRTWWHSTIATFNFLIGVFFTYFLLGSILFFGFRMID